MTPDQRAAHAALEDAVALLLDAYHDDRGGLLTDYVLVTAHHIDNAEDGTATALGSWVPPEQPLYRSLGLLEHQTARLRAHIAGNADLEEGR